ncbi:MAG: PKD domain-containing protein [Flavobacteriales bacterium]
MGIAKFIIVVFFGFQVSLSFAQCFFQQPVIGDSVCSSASLQVSNLDGSLVDFTWHLGFPSITTLPTSISLGNPGTSLETTYGITVVQEDSLWYGFVKKTNASTVFRYDFGTSLLNTPIVTPLYVNSFLNSTSISDENIEVLRINNQWYGYTTIRGGSSIVRYDFGSTLEVDTITAYNLGNPGTHLQTPFSLSVLYYGDSIYVAVGDFANNKLVLYNYGTNPLNSSPVWINAQAIGVGTPNTTNISATALYANCGEFYAFAAGFGTDNLLRLSYGNSFKSTPVRDQIGSLGNWLNPCNLNVIVEGGEVTLLAKSSSTTVNMISTTFGDSISQPANTIAVNSLANGAATSNGLGLESAVSDSGLTLFLIRGGNQLQRFHLPFQQGVESGVEHGPSPQLSTTSFGKFRLSYRFSDSLGNFQLGTDSVLILQSPSSDLSISGLCVGDTLELHATPTGAILDSSRWILGSIEFENVLDTGIVNATSGALDVMFISSSQGCQDTNVLATYIYSTPTPQISADTTCQNTPLLLNNTSFSDSLDSITSVLWTFGDGFVDSLFVPVHSYADSGLFHVELNISTSAGCLAKDSIAVYVKENPLADFKVDNTCFGDAALFTNNSSASISFTTVWDFGDGASSNIQSPSHQYPDTGNYLAKLITQSINGCQDSSVTLVRISPVPSMQFELNPDPFCELQQLEIIDVSASIDSIVSRKVIIGNDTFSIIDEYPTIPNSGVVQITYKITAGLECSIDSQFLISANPHPNVELLGTGGCVDELSHFSRTVDGLGPQSVIQTNWSLNGNFIVEGDTFELMNSQSGYQWINVQVMTDSGCISSDSSLVYIYDKPSSYVQWVEPFCSYSPLQFEAIFTSDTLDSISSISWLTSGARDSIYYGIKSDIVYDSAGNYSIGIQIQTSSGCSHIMWDNITLVEGVEVELNDDSICVGTIIEFDGSYSGSNYEWYWDFGDGSSSILSNPSHLFSVSGHNQVTAQLLDLSTGCGNDAVGNIYVADNAGITNILGQYCDGMSNVFYPLVQMDSLDAVNSILWHVNGQFVERSDSITVYAVGESNLNLKGELDTRFGCTSAFSRDFELVKVNPLKITQSPGFGYPPFEVLLEAEDRKNGSYLWIVDGDTVESNPYTSTITDSGELAYDLIFLDSTGCKVKHNGRILSFTDQVDLSIDRVELTQIGNGNYVAAHLFNNSQTPALNYVIQYVLNQQPIGVYESNDTLMPAQVTRFIFPLDVGSYANQTDLICLEVLEVNGKTDADSTNNSDCADKAEFVVYDLRPNPTNGLVHVPVVSPNARSVGIKITGTMGGLMRSFSTELAEGFQEVLIDLSDFSSGLYIVELDAGENTFVLEVVKY